MRNPILNLTQFSLLGLLLALGTALADDIQKANARLGVGVNFGNALDAPREGEWGVVLKEEFFELAKEAGFESIRLPVRWTMHAQAEVPYTIDPDFFERVDWAVDQATRRGLNIIIDGHHQTEFNKNPEGQLDRMEAIWRQVADRYRDCGQNVYFELHNEPHGRLDSVAWNAAIPKLLAAVRETNPDRPIIIGPVDYNGISALETLELPAGDCHLIVTVHFYDPFHFTHQGAEWIEGSPEWIGKEWEGTAEERALITARLEKAADWGHAKERPIFLGEFGAYSKADEASRVRWTRYVAEEAARLKMSTAYWEFCAGLGLYDAEKETWRDDLKAAVLGNAKGSSPSK